jgi:hypothetical protein
MEIIDDLQTHRSYQLHKIMCDIEKIKNEVKNKGYKKFLQGFLFGVVLTSAVVIYFKIEIKTIPEKTSFRDFLPKLLVEKD